MRIPAPIVAITALLLTSADALAQHRYEFDLAKRSPGELTLPAPPGQVSVVIRNRVPGRQYFYAVTREWVPIPPLLMPAGVAVPLGLAGPSPECLVVERTRKEIGSPADEPEVPAKAGAFAALRKSDAFMKCKDPTFTDPVDVAYQALTSTDLIGPVDLRSGEQLRIAVQRIAPNGTVDKSWTTVLTTGPRGEWLTTFGLSFVDDDDERFFTTPAAEANKFVITPERKPGAREMKFLPTVLFSWIPASQRGRYVVFSPTAGVGATSSTFAALLGVTATFNLNLGVTGGVAFSHHKRLLGKYNPGQIVAENLNDAQLHRQATMPAGFLSITLRFGQSPFAAPPSPPAATPAPAPPAPAAAPGAPPPPAAPPAGGTPPPSDSTPPKGGAPPAGDKPAPGAVPAPPGGE
jgi:hypothetical protein